jgi:multidrug efflux pump subunit AcrA (membrane-fusion protein)
MHLVCTFLFFLLTAVGSAIASPGHDHGEAAVAAPEAQIPRLEAGGSELELVATVEDHRLVIYLARSETNEPVDGASIEVSGDGIPVATAAPLGEGAYELEADWMEEPGTKALTFLVSTGDATDLLNGTLEIPAPEVASEATQESLKDWLARPEAWILGALCALFGFFLAFAFRPLRLPADDAEQPAKPAVPRTDSVVAANKRRTAQVAGIAFCLIAVGVTAALAGPGHDHGEEAHGGTTAGGNVPRKLPDGEVFLPKPSQQLLRVRTLVAKETSAQPATELIGTVIPDPAFEGRVQAPMDGEIELARDGFAFVGQTVKAGDVLAELAPAMPVFERGSLEQMAADVEGKLAIAEARHARLTRIPSAVTQREIEDTETEVKSLRAQRSVLQPKPAQRLLLEAPVSGVISVANVRPGQVVNAKDTLFEIVDPNRLWIEAVGAGGLDDYSAVSKAQAVDGSGKPATLVYVRQAPTLRQHSRPLFFRVEQPAAALAIGATVKVLLQKGEPVQGIVLPRSAVVRGTTGLPQVWTKVGAERFKPLTVRTTQLDGSSVLVTAGLEAGSRVVVEGSELINQVR